MTTNTTIPMTMTIVSAQPTIAEWRCEKCKALLGEERAAGLEFRHERFRNGPVSATVLIERQSTSTISLTALCACGSEQRYGLVSVRAAVEAREEHERIERGEPRSCNRHKDCDAANERARAAGKIGAEHCHDEGCDECFGS
jgi:hypothetical protein